MLVDRANLCSQLSKSASEDKSSTESSVNIDEVLLLDRKIEAALRSSSKSDTVNKELPTLRAEELIIPTLHKSSTVQPSLAIDPLILANRELKELQFRSNPEEKNPDSQEPRRLRYETVSGGKLKTLDVSDEPDEKEDNSIAESS